MLERSLLLSYGQHDIDSAVIEWCQQFMANLLLSVIDKMPKTPLHKALHVAIMILKNKAKANCEQPLVVWYLEAYLTGIWFWTAA
jgi:hypothetical protein